MSVIQAIGGSFALDQHGMRSESPFVAAAHDLSAAHEPLPLLLVADPVEMVPGAAEVAEDILHGMAVFLRHTMNHDVRRALITAFKTANERVQSENRQRNDMRRLYLGLTCIVLDGDELWVAQCAPSQVLVWQDQELYAIPSLHTWSAEQITESFSDLSYPLGFRATIEPRVSYSRCVAGDLIAVVSWPVAKYLAQIDGAGDISGAHEFIDLVTDAEPATGPHALHGAVFEFGDALQTTHPLHHPVVWPDRVENSSGLPLDDSFPARESIYTNGNQRQKTGSVRPDDHYAPPFELPSTGSRDASGFDTLGADNFSLHRTDDIPQLHSTAYDVDSYDLPATPARFRASQQAETPDEVSHSRHDQRFQTTEMRTYRVATPTARKGNKVEIFAGLLLSLTAAVVGVWQVTKRDRPIHGPRDDGTLGLPHLQRWSDSYQAPRFEGLRRASPRFQASGFVKLAIVLAVLLVAGGLIYTQVLNRNEQRNASIDERLQSITTIRTRAETSTNSRSAYESLMGAQVTLGELASTATADDVIARIQEEQAAVAAALDTIAAVKYVTSVQVMGSVPAAPEGIAPEIFSGNGRVFIFSDGLYELDQTTGSLIRLLQPGDEVGGSAVGPLIGATWNEDRPVAIDARNAFMLDPATGDWHRVPLGTLGPDGYAGVAATAMFNRSIYFLTPESGQILKFDALDFSAMPEDWTAGIAKEQLQNAVDLIVDGSIHVALADGRVLTFFRSALETTVQAPVTPELDSVSGLTMSSSGQYFYIVNESDGRIICIDRDGNVVRQFVPAAGAPELTGATSVVVNETTGISHVIAGNTLYAIRLTLPEEAPD